LFPAADVAQLVERNLAKVEVAGSNPVVRSTQNPRSRTVFRAGPVSFGLVHPIPLSHPWQDSRNIGLVKGSVRNRDRGVWEVRVYLGRDADSGKKRYRSRTVRGARRDAEKVCRDLVAKIEAAASDGRANDFLSVSAWLDDWWEAKRATISPTTASAWQSSLELYLKPEIGQMSLFEVRAHHLEALYQRLVEDGLSAARVQKIHTVASVAFKAAVRRELIAASPAATARPPSVGRREPTAPTPDEVALILRASLEDPELYSFLVVAANTGARRAEICALRWCDVDLEERVIAISQSVVKGGGGGAAVRQTKTGVAGQTAISEQVAETLGRLHVLRVEAASSVGEQLSSTAFIWAQDVCGLRPVYPDTMSARFARVRDEVGLGHVQLRHFRHFAATQLLSAGVDVRTVAGRLRHASPAMTLNRYAAWVPARDREAAEVLDNLG
jgi:integrase